MAQFHDEPDTRNAEFIVIDKDADETRQVLVLFGDLFQDAELVLEFMREIVGRQTNDLCCCLDSVIDSFCSIHFAVGPFA